MRRILLALCILLSVLNLLAADITPQEALNIASTFIQKDKTAQVKIRKTSPGTRVTPSIAHKVPSRVAANKDNVYIINLGDNQGFVVVSGETGTTANILGYCDHGAFDIDNAPIPFLDLINEYSAGIDNLRNVPSSVRSQMAAPLQANYPSYIGDIVVGPLLTTTWNQTGPYNGQCPSDENNNRCYTGCVPTAVAQVMNYWKWPKVSKDSIYGLRPDSTYGMIDFSGHTYDWDNMLDYYGWSSVTDSFISYNQTQADAVALLMADIGKAMRTMYCQENGSPTYFEYNALVRNFGYEVGIEVVRGDRAADVKNALKAELDEKRPVLYTGKPALGDGHALVCDGYTENNYFHFNYGWGGQTDGFYRLSAIPSYINDVVIWTNFRPYDATEKVINGIKYGLLPNGNADILEYVGGGVGVQNGVLVIPDSVTDDQTGNTYAVTHICKESFFRKGNFLKMVMGNNIESIDRFSFVYTNIDTLVLSDKMEEVPEAAFQITNVKHLTIGANIKRIGALAFNTCPLNDIVCKSPRVELGKSCFTMAQPKHGDWEKCIVKIDNKAFNGARLNQNTYFENLEVLGDSAMTGVIWGGTGVLDFTVGPKVREIAPSAFDGHGDGIYLPMLSVSADNPYFTTYDNEPILYNKDTTSVHLVLDRAQYINKTKVIKMEPGCIRGAMDDVVIPPSAVDMEGAFRDCKPPKYSATVTCHHMTPPAISDATFPDTLFSPDAGGMYLKVPEGTESLYAEAPGWRKFGYNMYAMDSSEFIPLPPQDLQYQMKIHGDSLKITAPIADVSSMRMTEENGEATVTLQINGRVDMKTPVTHIDSIIFVPGFVYEGAEIFELNDSSTTVKGQECSINFESTTFSENAQVCLRNSVLLPRPTEGVTGGVGIDISMLNDSGRVHELSGVATITIPFPVPANQSVVAAYFNEQTGEWEPVYVEYDRDAGVATIVTDHLSAYALVSVAKENTKMELMEVLKLTVPYVYTFDEATRQLLYILQSDDPEMQQALQFKDEMSLWQAVGLDGFYNGVIAVSEPLFNFKPQAVDNAVSILGHIGTALTVLDVLRAELQGDKIAVASNTLKVIAAQAGSIAAAAIGTPVLTASLSMVAFVGIALEKFGTNVRNNKMNYFRAAYKYYYSMDGYNLLGGRSTFAWDKNGKLKPHGHYRTRQDWYDFFYPVFLKKDMDAERLMMYIKESVEDYCDQFWTDDMQREILDEIDREGIYGQETYPDRELQKKISEDYFAELMNGDLVSVFTSLRKKQIVQANDRALEEIKKMAKLMNKKVAFRITDSSVTEGQPSSFAGWTIGFPILDENVADAGKWRKTIGNDGRVDLGWFTMYALVRNLMPFKLTLFNTAGEAVKNFDFQLDGEADKKVIRIDLATQGMVVDNKHIDELQLKYTPDSVNFYFAGIDEDDKYQNPLQGAVVYMDEERGLYSNQNQVRWRTEVERFFNRHNYITVDSIGNFTIGEDIDGTFVGDSATGTFIIDTDYKFFLQTAPQYIDTWNDPQSTLIERLRILFNGSFKHQMACKYKVVRKRVGDHEEYDVTYTGEGFFDITARHINEFKKYLDWYAIAISDVDGILPLYLNDIGIGTSSVGGDVTLEYKVTLK